MTPHGSNQQNPKCDKFDRVNDTVSSTNEWQEEKETVCIRDLRDLATKCNV